MYIIFILLIFLILFNNIIIYEKLNNYDNYITYFSIFTIILLLFSYLIKNNTIKDLSHIFITLITLIFSLNINNKKLLMIIILPIILTIYFWIFHKKCPLGNYNNFYYINKFVKYIDNLNLSYPTLLVPLFILFYKLFK